MAPPIEEFFAPESLEEAVGILHEKNGAACVLAGGTDVMVRVKRGEMPATRTALLSLHRIASLRGCRREHGEIVIGAATTAADLIRDPVVNEDVPILARVADRVASAQIRNMATIGGNLANASPAGDLINPLLLLDAEVTLVSADVTRAVAVDRFFTGPGESVLRPDEILGEIRVPVPPPGRVFRFEKAGTRPAMECSVVTVGIAFTPMKGCFTDVRVAFGSCAPTPLRGRKTEAVLEGETISPETIERAGRTAHDEVSPISDVRGSEAYRRVLARVFVTRLLGETAP